MSTLLVTVIILAVLIVTHELGHFIIAKLVGMRVHEFSIGMGPAIFSTRRGETTYSLRAFPIGGFNRIAGMEPGDLEDERGFRKKSVGQRMAVIGAGSIMNFILAILVFIYVFMGIGVPSNTTVVGGVLPGRPAELAGLQRGDRVLEIGEPQASQRQKVATWNEMVDIIHRNAGKSLDLLVERSGRQMQITVTPEPDPQSEVGLIGVKQMPKKLGFLEAIRMGISQALALGVLIATSLVRMITGQTPADLAGPIGIVQLTGEAARMGIGSILEFIGFFSLNLGVINLFPIPALDGSRLVFLGLEGLRGRPVNPERENFIHLVGFALLMLVMIAATYKDLLRIFS